MFDIKSTHNPLPATRTPLPEPHITPPHEPYSRTDLTQHKTFNTQHEIAPKFYLKKPFPHIQYFPYICGLIVAR
jgi:hypothetical protein